MGKNKIEPETATYEADLPHQYRSPDGSRNHVCELCQSLFADPRHLAFELAARHRESASAAQMPRETGV